MYGKTTKYVIIFSISMAVNCFARIGETLEKCKERYGKIVNTINEPVNLIYCFMKDGIKVEVYIYNNKAFQIIYRKAGMTKEEANVLLGANLPTAKFNDRPIDNVTYQIYSLDKEPDNGLTANFYDCRIQGLLGGIENTQVIICNTTLAKEVKALGEKKKQENRTEQAEKLRDGF